MSAASTGEEGIITCPYCGDSVPTLVSIDAGMKLRLQQGAQLNPVPESVCEGCFGVLSKMVSKGASLRAEAQAKEQNRIMLWRNRVSLVKQAKQHLSRKDYADAAISLEKYLRVLEIVFEVKSGELTPDLFKSQARAQEMTVITSVYWDLMRIYDTNPGYADRQKKAADKLSKFVRFTPIFPQIMRKAEAQTRNAKNPAVFKQFIKMSGSSRPRCFIATSAFSPDRYTPLHPTVLTLCEFRDLRLKTHFIGRKSVYWYYRVSPVIASHLDQHPALKPFVRWALTWVAQSRFVRNSLKS